MGYRYPEEFKVEVLAYLSKVGNVFNVASRFRVHPSTVYIWRRNFLQAVADSRMQPAPDQEQEPIQKLKEKIAFLERENAVLKEAVRIYLNC